MVNFRKTDIFNVSEGEWAPYHTFRKIFHSENSPNEPIMADKVEEEIMKGEIQNSDMQIHNYWIYDKTQIIGTFYYGYYSKDSKNYPGNEKLVRFEIRILISHVRKGIGTMALQMMVEETEKINKSVFLSEYQNSALIPFFKAVGGKIVQINSESKLDLGHIDPNLIQSWIQEGESKNPETKIYIFEKRIPDDLLVEFVKAFNDSLEHIPLDNMEMRRRKTTVESWRNREKSDLLGGILSIMIVTVEKNGFVSGITDVKRIPGREKFLSQAITGVPIAFRGRKIGKWIKAKMILYLKEKYPTSEAILTGNANSNDSMLYINTKLGFKKYKESISAQIYLKDLKNYLETKKEINLISNFEK